MKCKLSFRSCSSKSQTSLINLHVSLHQFLSRLPFSVSLAMNTEDAEQREFYSL